MVFLSLNYMIFFVAFVLGLLIYYAIVHGMLCIAYYYLSQKYPFFKKKWKCLISFFLSLIPPIIYCFMVASYSLDFCEVNDIDVKIISNRDKCLLHDIDSIHNGISFSLNFNFVPGLDAKKTIFPSKQQGRSGLIYPIKGFKVQGFSGQNVIDLTNELYLKDIEYKSNCSVYYRGKLSQENISLLDFINDINNHEKYASPMEIYPLWFSDSVDPSAFDSVVVYAVITHKKSVVNFHKTIFKQ